MEKSGKNIVLFAGDRLFLKFPTLEYFKERLSEVDGELISTEGMDDREFISAARDVAAVVLIARELNRRIIESMDNCKLIMTLSVGYDCVDVGAATEKGIPVSNSPTYCSDDVANHAMTLLLACTRKLHHCLEETASGGWDYKVGKPMYNYTGKKLGIIGLGKIGRAVLPKARGFGMETAAYDPYIADDIFDLLGVERKYELPDLLRDADYVTIHVPLTGETRHMINSETLSMMKSHAVPHQYRPGRHSRGRGFSGCTEAWCDRRRRNRCAGKGTAAEGPSACQQQANGSYASCRLVFGREFRKEQDTGHG